MKKLVILTGAGMSAESGISTFRGAEGLWEDHDIYEVASPVGWANDPLLVLKFYNERRRKLQEVAPNKGHLALKELEDHFDVVIVTQNVDDLHERAGSSNVIHLHGELLKVQSTDYPELVYEWKDDLNWGDTCEKGAQLRPFVVWFGEDVPKMAEAAQVVAEADVLAVIGTSMVVYPAAGLIHLVGPDIPKYLIDPNLPEIQSISNLEYIQSPATLGVPELAKRLLNE